ncbi:hypothetical protein R6Q59_030825 [Mikania micrantha]|uniref:LOB domain-containing protein n=1 Tax=Mikania micrantha TaxID=192012 RepID=A0A5N6NYB4_9ASTR|nr:hypothetical protein E3N88_43882 [Mikania micrantha]KAD5508559.1 hypothetical protein E3N88_16262 [Mikania micrantha]
MTEPNTKSCSLNRRVKSSKKRVSWSTKSTPLKPSLGSTSGVPCGACKFLRRRCIDGCIFAPHFSPEHETTLFAAVHKVFGASNVSKLLMQIPMHHRSNAVEAICYEAQARLSDPVCGLCLNHHWFATTGTSFESILSKSSKQTSESFNIKSYYLSQQVAALQMELAMVQNRFVNTRLMVANTLHGSPQQPELLNHLGLQPNQQLDLQPVYSNDSSDSNSYMSMFDSSLYNNTNDHQTDFNPLIFDHLQFTEQFYKN